MKKYIKLIPLMLFPYAYLIWLFFLNNLIPDNISMHMPEIYMTLTLVFTIISTVIVAKNKNSAVSAAKQNLIVKAVQIPAYIFHFILGLAGFVASVWGIGFIMFAVIIDFMTIILTGVFAVGCNIKICRQGVISKGTAVVTSIFSFVYCTDLIIAVILLVASKSYEKKSLVQKENI